jgi:hypothetical protein
LGLGDGKLKKLVVDALDIKVTPTMIEAGLDAFLSYVFEDEVTRATTGLEPGLKAAFRAMLERSAYASG